MSIIRMHEVTTLTPEQFVAGVTDFGPGRQEIFPNSADGELKVHSQGPHRADVTEGRASDRSASPIKGCIDQIGRSS